MATTHKLEEKLTDTQWFEALVSALGAHLGQHLELHVRGFLALEDERGQTVLVVQLAPGRKRADLFAPILDFDAGASPEIELIRARTLLEMNGNEDFLGGLVICCDPAREQYILRGSVSEQVSGDQFIELVTNIVAAADELKELALPAPEDQGLPFDESGVIFKV